MTDEQSRVLRETHDAIVELKATMEERCQACLGDVDQLTMFVDGSNGDKGAKSRLAILEGQAKVVWGTAVGVVALVGEALVEWVRAIM